MNALIFLLASLACFRLTRLVTDDKITDWLRSLVVRKAPRKIKAKAEYGITCPFCVSAYHALAITFYLWWIGVVPADIAWVYGSGVWGGSIIWNEIFVALMGKAK